MKQILTVGLLAWSTAQAVELGALAVSSTTGQPFKASIPIVLEANQSLEDVSAAIVATEPSVSDITFVLADSPKPAIRLSTQAPVDLKQFKLTLQISDVKEDNEYHYELSLAPASKTAGKAFSYGPVKQGDTLWHVASQFSKYYKLTPEQATAALYEHNPKAFSKGDKNQLMAGSYLKLPATIGKTTSTKTKVVRFEPKEVVTQTRQVASIPEFPEMTEGKQVALNIPGALKALNSLKDADTGLFSTTLQSVLGAEASTVTSTLDHLQEQLLAAREAIELEREAKLSLQNQVEDLNVQLRAVTELISLQDVRVEQSFALPTISLSDKQNQWLLIIAAFGIASLLMVSWDRFRTKKPAKAVARMATPVSKPMAMSGDVYEGDPPCDPVQTKLDLARAYIDIGDKVSAREILLEVAQEGSPSQKTSAEVLIHQLD